MRRMMRQVRIVTVLVLLVAPAVSASDPLELLERGEYSQIFELAASTLPSADVPVDRKLEILRATATAHLLNAPPDSAQARGAMEAMLALDPAADFTPGYRYPAAVHALFREVRSTWDGAASDAVSAQRIAIAPFYLIDLGASARFDWQAFADALPFILTSDLEPVGALKLLSREHLDAIASEISLATEDELVSPENRIRLGQLLSAGAFLYGEVHALPGDEVGLELRWVQTETGVTLLARQGAKRIRRGGDLLELEREVVLESFLPAMLTALGGAQLTSDAKPARESFKRKVALAGRGDLYLEYVAAVARATQAEEAGRLEEALQCWQEASALVPDMPAAHEKARALALTLHHPAGAASQEPDK